MVCVQVMLAAVAVLYGTNFGAIKYLDNCDVDVSIVTSGRFLLASIALLPFLWGQSKELFKAGFEVRRSDARYRSLPPNPCVVALLTTRWSRCCFAGWAGGSVGVSGLYQPGRGAGDDAGQHQRFHLQVRPGWWSSRGGG